MTEKNTEMTELEMLKAEIAVLKARENVTKRIKKNMEVVPDIRERLVLLYKKNELEKIAPDIDVLAAMDIHNLRKVGKERAKFTVQKNEIQEWIVMEKEQAEMTIKVLEDRLEAKKKGSSASTKPAAATGELSEGKSKSTK